METKDIRTDSFTGNQALQLLWLHWEDLKCSSIVFSQAELSYLQLEVIFDWENINTSYRDLLITLDKGKLISIMSANDNIFKNDRRTTSTMKIKQEVN